MNVKKCALISAAGVALIQALSGQPALADANWDRYADSGYSYCDAVVLASYWGGDALEAKSTIGAKLGWDNPDEGKAAIQGALRRSRGDGNRCAFQDTTFTLVDATILAQHWNTSLGEAKAALAEKVSLGRMNDALDAMNEARASIDH